MINLAINCGLVSEQIVLNSNLKYNILLFFATYAMMAPGDGFSLPWDGSKSLLNPYDTNIYIYIDRPMGLMELFNCTLILLLFSCLLASSSDASDIEPIVLTDETFEHDTQASTGQTTGIWAIRFCSGGQAQAGQQDILSSCSQTDTVWKRLAGDLLESENIIVADVRVEKEKGLLKRFEEQFVVPHNGGGEGQVLKRHPVVIMFRQHRNMYVKDWILPKGMGTYDDERVFQEMRTWITTGWETASSPVDVPPEPAWYHDILAGRSSMQFTQQQIPYYSYISIAVAITVLLIVVRGLKNSSLRSATKRD